LRFLEIGFRGSGLLLRGRIQPKASAIGAIMRLLIGFYMVLGLAPMILACAICFFVVRSRLVLVADLPAGHQHLEEGLPSLHIAALEFAIGLLPLFAAYGLWKRWRLVRLVLLGLSWWTLAVCAFAAVVALAMLAGWTDGRVLGTNDPPGLTLLLSLAFSTFAAFQGWLLMRRAVRAEF
jgi:hypothetical protein